MKLDRLTVKSQEAIQRAVELAKDNSQQGVQPLHLLLALLEQDSVVSVLLKEIGVSLSLFIKKVKEEIESLPKIQGKDVDVFISSELNNVFTKRPSISNTVIRTLVEFFN